MCQVAGLEVALVIVLAFEGVPEFEAHGAEDFFVVWVHKFTSINKINDN